jgi:polyprenyl-phospho-N-acetylgalactosaminyl synthase
MTEFPPADRTRIWAVIAAYHEASVIGEVVTELRRHVDNVVVVDDGSRDGTGDAALAAGAVTLRHSLNLGQGAALQTGIDFALAQAAELIVTFDADGQHDPGDIGVMAAIQRERGVEMVLGSRFLGRAQDLPRMRRLVLQLARKFTNVTTGVRLTDAHNGLRLMTASAARRIRITQNRMAHASELIEQIRTRKITFAEAPVTIRYTRYSLAKGQKLSGAAKIFADLATRWIST